MSRWSPTIVRARNRARFVRVARGAGCQCSLNVHMDGPCAACEARIEDAEQLRDAPDPDLEDRALQRIETGYERWLESTQ